MSSAPKRAHLALETPDTTESDSDGSELTEGSEEDSDVETNGDQEDVQVDFEARAPLHSDADGMKALMAKIFDDGLSCSVNLTLLSDYIIAQRTVGSVITQSVPEDLSDEDEDCSEFGEVYGVTTVVNVSKSVESELVKSLREYLIQSAQLSGCAGDVERLSAILEDPSKKVAFLISERIINIPAEISLPLYDTLYSEIQKAKAKNMPFDFDYFVLKSKVMKAPGGGSQENGDSSSQAKAVGLQKFFVNQEEEIFQEHSDIVFEFDKQKKKDDESKVIDISDAEYKKCSKILVFPEAKFSAIVGQLKVTFPA